jgi:hypothetical protein
MMQSRKSWQLFIVGIIVILGGLAGCAALDSAANSEKHSDHSFTVVPTGIPPTVAAPRPLPSAAGPLPMPSRTAVKLFIQTPNGPHPNSANN